MRETPFYKTNWFTILMLIVFFPVGLFLMWVNKKWTVATRVVVSIVIVVLAIVGYSTQDNQTGNIAASRETAAKEKKKNSENSKQESKTNITKDEKEKHKGNHSKNQENPDKLTEERLVKDVQKLVGEKAGDKQKVAKIDLISTADDNNQPKKTVNITLNGSDNLTTKMIRKGMFVEAEKIFPKIFENKEVERVILIWKFPLVDVKGNSESEKVLSIQIERKTNDQINWDNFDRDNFATVADHYYEHPALNKE
ncbi:hypothetical protein LG208_05965 [Bacillus paralicheniformis]|uniref:hypothetical protein n=1 Tax=Bacillus paralicheniformis TaxID=1648923 RepID=UPI001C22FB45|nr:hypothetical protein [Bacillus paralicheniformis]MBU8759252.1 hypothetical protein [Bacillus paralicheniformis]MCY1629439.1 hypothetical protein [Bacillus paralicheniformis]